MSAIEVLVRPEPERPVSSPLEPLLGVLDFIVDGINLTARLGQGAALGLLGELGSGVALLSRGKRDRITAPFYSGDEAWEIGLEAEGDGVLVSVYRTAPNPAVAVHEKRVELLALRDALKRALGLAATLEAAPRALSSAQAALAAPWPSFGRGELARVTLRVATPDDEPFSIACEARFRQQRARREARSDEPELERSELHSLLAAGCVRLRTGAAELELPRTFPLLAAERFLALADEALEAYRDERPLFRRVKVDGAQLAARWSSQSGGLVLKLTRDGATADSGIAIAGIAPPAFARAAARFALGLEAAFRGADPQEARNLRLQHLAREARALESHLDSVLADDSVKNPDPESYRSFGLAPRPSARGKWEHGGKMRFIPRWVANVPSIDLGATFQCGERVVVSSPRQTACLDRTSGAVLWRKALPRAASVPTPLGLVRLTQDGGVTLYDLERGEARFTLRLAPRAHGGSVGAVVNAPGLPRLLAVAESDRAITAIDLVSGDVRWRHTAPRSSAFKLRRAGRLLLVAGGDSALLALDAATGEVVWRVRERLPFTPDLSFDRDAAFVTAGGPVGPTRAYHIDLWTGEVRWSRELPARPTPGHPPLVTPAVVAFPTRDRRGSGLAAFDRETGESLFELAPGYSAPATSWLAVDDTLIGNSASGRLFGLDAANGKLRYAHDFPRHVEADQPRRLEPVLRSGALFVPQQHVHVLRPRDGETLGTLPSDLIPDLLRVDEQCNVYVAEESGHVAAFGVAPRLTLVR
ncbi:MAG TPA: PQQ-binding-like beta-propeller repeat protein [Polyangiaceae bacterium]